MAYCTLYYVYTYVYQKSSTVYHKVYTQAQLQLNACVSYFTQPAIATNART